MLGYLIDLEMFATKRNRFWRTLFIFWQGETKSIRKGLIDSVKDFLRLSNLMMNHFFCFLSNFNTLIE